MAARTKNNQIKFYLSDEDIEKFKNNLTKSKLKQGKYLRYLAIEKPIIVIDGLEDSIHQLKKIGTNINQIAKLLNSGRIVDCRKDLEFTKKELNQIWLSLNQLVQKVQ